VSFLLQDAAAHGWTIPDHKSDYQSCEVYSFLSDSVRQAAYSTIPSDQLDSFHLMIGRKLWKGFDEQDSANLQPKHQSLILSQMLQGARAIINPQELAATAALCLSVAKEDVKWSTFSTAAISLDKGINLLGHRSWREEYDLTLALHNTSAEVNYVLGDFDVVHRRCEAIFQNARMVDHTLLASSVKISILSAESNIDEALKIGHWRACHI
jgi:predicted ATPase